MRVVSAAAPNVLRSVLPEYSATVTKGRLAHYFARCFANLGSEVLAAKIFVVLSTLIWYDKKLLRT